MNVESIAEVKVLTSGYQAEYGRSSGLQITRRHQERHQPLPRIGLRRRAQLRLEREQQDQQAQRRSQAGPEGEGLGLLDRRPDRQAGREQQAVLLLQPGVLAAHGAERRPALPHADRARARRGLLAVDRQQRHPVPYIKDPRVTGTCSAADQTACFRDGGVLGRIPADRLYQTGLNILKHVSAAEHRAPGVQLQLRAHPGRPRAPDLAAGRSPRLPADAEAARDRSSTRAGSSGTQIINGSLPGFQRHEDAAAGRQHAGDRRSTTPSARRRSSRRPTGTARTSWPAARWRRPPPGRCSARPPSRNAARIGEAGTRGPSDAVPGRNVINPGLLRDARRSTR